MKRYGAILAALCLLLSGLLAACGRGETADGTEWTARQVAWAVLASQGETPALKEPGAGEALGEYLSLCYQLDPRQVEDGAVFYAGGVSALEVAVLRLGEEPDAEAAERALLDYIDARTGAFTGYAPEQAALLERSGAVTRGRWTALLICPDQQAAREAFASCFQGGEPPEGPPWGTAEDAPAAPVEEPPPEEPEPEPVTEAEVPPEEPLPEPESDPELESPPEPEPEPDPPPLEEPPWSYDEERLLTAWAAGGWDGLPERDRAILDKCREVIDAWAGPELTDCQRELALHDWLIAWAEYDRDSLDQDGGTDPDFETPYGLLIRQRGICRGYASTFQLLMKLIGIECVTVEGMSHGGTAEHAWNMVELDGEWYCVDVTWDDPIASGPVSVETAHRYFNVTSAFLRQQDHQWDGALTPEATGTAWAWAQETHLEEG